MKFEEKTPEYDKAIEVYTPACKDECMGRAFANSVKISLKKQIGQGGQAAVYECHFRCED